MAAAAAEQQETAVEAVVVCTSQSCTEQQLLGDAYCPVIGPRRNTQHDNNSLLCIFSHGCRRSLKNPPMHGPFLFLYSRSDELVRLLHASLQRYIARNDLGVCESCEFLHERDVVQMYDSIWPRLCMHVCVIPTSSRCYLLLQADASQIAQLAGTLRQRGHSVVEQVWHDTPHCGHYRCVVQSLGGSLLPHIVTTVTTSVTTPVCDSVSVCCIGSVPTALHHLERDRLRVLVKD